MPICLNIGQGTGIAAAIAARKNISVRDVDVREIQQKLLASGVRP